jgi:CBS domain containing-hemolysin-like protein
LFFYRPFHLFFFPEHEYETLFFTTVCAQNITRFIYAISAYILISNTPLFEPAINNAGLYDFTAFWILLSFFTFILVGFTVGDYLPRIFGTRFPVRAFKMSAPFASVFMFLVFPVSYIFLKIPQSFSRTIYFDHLQEPAAQAKQELIDIIQKSSLSPDISKHDAELVESVLSFRDRIVREVMVPRVNVFSLPADTTIRKAAQLLDKEGYSRTPVYRDSVDDITGVLMHKDILRKYMEYEEKGNDKNVLEAPIESIQKNILYTPETKKISNLLQEFRKKQMHLAIVVDEYGGTEGIATIEDILEEIVGEIADEYDDQKALYIPQSDGSWIVDARMSILDAEEYLGVVVPQEGEYDTIGGFIYHKAGAIPSKGFVIHQDTFEIEVIRSNERSVEKVRIRPIEKDDNNNHNSMFETHL